MYKTDLKDETFSLNNSAQYELLLQFLPKSFSYSVFDKQRNKFVLLRYSKIENNKKNYLDTIKDYFEKDEFLSLKFDSIKVILASSKSVFVPKPLFDKNKIIELLNYNSQIGENEIVLFDELKNEMYNIYSFDKYLFEFINNYYSKIEYFNQGSVLLGSNINKKSSAKRKIIIEANLGFYDILLIENNELIFRNIFKYTNETDFVFYVISTFDKFKIDNENDEINISGIFTTESKEIELLRKYIKKIRFKRTESNYSYVFNDIDINIYTNLLNLQNCE